MYMKKHNTFERGISTPVLIGLVAAGLLVIGGLVYVLQQGGFQGNSNEEEVPMEENGDSLAGEQEEQGVDTTGLIIEDIHVGEGQELIPGDVIRVHYEGTLEDGTKFDSSYDRGEPFELQIGVGQVISGWDVGLEGMKVGGKRKLTIPANLAYGDAGAGDIIPPGATLIFEVELLEIVEIKG